MGRIVLSQHVFWSRNGADKQGSITTMHATTSLTFASLARLRHHTASKLGSSGEAESSHAML